jgi:hypothetical protein
VYRVLEYVAYIQIAREIIQYGVFVGEVPLHPEKRNHRALQDGDGGEVVDGGGV